jgi:hypothetical protein
MKVNDRVRQVNVGNYQYIGVLLIFVVSNIIVDMLCSIILQGPCLVYSTLLISYIAQGFSCQNYEGVWAWLFCEKEAQ